jgi:subtilase family serine protease
MRSSLRRIALASLFVIIATAQQDRVVLRGNTPPRIAQAVDAGPVPASFQLRGLTLQFQRTPAQQSALDQLLKDRQDPASPLFHKWLTPEETADRFGLSRDKIARVSSWLRSHGFRIGQLARGREWIVFSGNAKQVREAFHVEIHRYRWENKMHYANNTDPSIPATLASAVSGLHGLDDFLPSPLTVPPR